MQYAGEWHKLILAGRPAQLISIGMSLPCDKWRDCQRHADTKPELQSTPVLEPGFIAHRSAGRWVWVQVVQAYLYELFTSGEYSKAAELMPSLLQASALLSTPQEQAAASSCITWPAQVACPWQCPKVRQSTYLDTGQSSSCCT